MIFPGRFRFPSRLAFLATLLAATSGCTLEEKIVSATALGSTYATTRPVSNLEQIYYLGVFDPAEQIPPTIYRVRVRGQGGALSSVKFASGWVPAAMVDSLDSTIAWDENTNDLKITSGQNGSALSVDRRMMLFGPEGFREAPKDHRLVIVMGSNADAYFNAVSEGLTEIAGRAVKAQDDQLQLDMLRSLLKLRKERVALDRFAAE